MISTSTAVYADRLASREHSKIILARRVLLMYREVRVGARLRFSTRPCCVPAFVFHAVFVFCAVFSRKLVMVHGAMVAALVMVVMVVVAVMVMVMVVAVMVMVGRSWRWW